MIDTAAGLQWPEADAAGQARVSAAVVQAVRTFVAARSWSSPPWYAIVPDPPPRPALTTALAAPHGPDTEPSLVPVGWGSRDRGRAWLTAHPDAFARALAIAFAWRSDMLMVAVDDQLTPSGAPMLLAQVAASRGTPQVAGLLGFEWGELREAWPR